MAAKEKVCTVANFMCSGCPASSKETAATIETFFQNHDQAATIAFPTELGTINLNIPTQRIGFYALAHGLHKLAVNQPCCSVVHTKLPHECQRGNPSLGLVD